jgi:hypothetical protein
MASGGNVRATSLAALRTWIPLRRTVECGRVQADDELIERIRCGRTCLDDDLLVRLLAQWREWARKGT